MTVQLFNSIALNNVSNNWNSLYGTPIRHGVIAIGGLSWFPLNWERWAFVVAVVVVVAVALFWPQVRDFIKQEVILWDKTAKK